MWGKHNHVEKSCLKFVYLHLGSLGFIVVKCNYTYKKFPSPLPETNQHLHAHVPTMYIFVEYGLVQWEDEETTSIVPLRDFKNEPQAGSRCSVKWGGGGSV